jgi:hypothetical protein
MLAADVGPFALEEKYDEWTEVFWAYLIKVGREQEVALMDPDVELDGAVRLVTQKDNIIPPLEALAILKEMAARFVAITVFH